MEEEEQVLFKALHKALEERNLDEEIGVRLELANYYYQHDNTDKARVSLNKIKEIEPKLKNLHYYTALIDAKENNIDEAEEELQKELKLYPKNFEAKKLKRILKVQATFPIITIMLIAINILIFTFMYPAPFFSDLLLYASHQTNVFSTSLITSQFIHASLLHLAVNMVVLLLFGLALEKNIGSLPFLFIYLSGGALGNAIQALLVPQSFVVGASSGIFAIMAALMLREPLLKLNIFFLLKVPIIIVFGIYFSYSVLASTNTLSVQDVSVGEIAHITGFLTGILLTVLLFQERILVFYSWIMISSASWVLIKSILLLVSSEILTLANFFSEGIKIAISILLIAYSYFMLKSVTTSWEYTQT
ncbi:MAG: rhomboid family intramembrane serine protease [Candidatus Woesearchaeota archaeon]|nr:MAG: rhomboid family intramembrane serine protease [Candidatus Woesearchaeota archaeon]